MPAPDSSTSPVPSSVRGPAARVSAERIRAGLADATRHLLSLRTRGGHWEGELSSSALSTATAVVALAIYGRNSGSNRDGAVRRGLEWLATQANPDGGWGDTTRSLSNLSTTALCWAAFGAVPGADQDHAPAVSRAELWLARNIGAPRGELRRSLDRLADAIIRRYGNDRTFSAPILTMCALSGRLGAGPEAWRRVMQLPFELAALPHQFFAAARLPVVSYALPALIAIGQVRHFHRPSRNPLARLIRRVTHGRTLRLLGEIQPEGGGYLEATPLTSFVLMSLAGSGQVLHPAAPAAARFLERSQRADGSWPIDTNLATWTTTLAVNALPETSAAGEPLASDAGARIRGWLLRQQHRVEHPYTHAARGGWAWTDLPGGVPDADDTAGALLALSRLQVGVEPDRESVAAVEAGIRWLLRLQNKDGGIPTFCRGWGALPFDRSSPDLTAHAILAWNAWLNRVAPPSARRMTAGLARAVGYLETSQRPDGAWLPLWFGNQHAPNDENPLYGTARVIQALSKMHGRFPEVRKSLEPALGWLLRAQNGDGGWGPRVCMPLQQGVGTARPQFASKPATGCGDEPSPPLHAYALGWGGAPGTESSVEETGLAVQALAEALCQEGTSAPMLPEMRKAINGGTAWLLARVESGEWTQPSPIGFYFAKLWYWEKLYPVIFTVAALSAAARCPDAPAGD